MMNVAMIMMMFNYEVVEDAVDVVVDVVDDHDEHDSVEEELGIDAEHCNCIPHRRFRLKCCVASAQAFLCSFVALAAPWPSLPHWLRVKEGRQAGRMGFHR